MNVQSLSNPDMFAKHTRYGGRDQLCNGLWWYKELGNVEWTLLERLSQRLKLWQWCIAHSPWHNLTWVRVSYIRIDSPSTRALIWLRILRVLGSPCHLPNMHSYFIWPTLSRAHPQTHIHMASTHGKMRRGWQVHVGTRGSEASNITYVVKQPKPKRSCSPLKPTLDRAAASPQRWFLTGGPLCDGWRSQRKRCRYGCHDLLKFVYVKLIALIIKVRLYFKTSGEREVHERSMEQSTYPTFQHTTPNPPWNESVQKTGPSIWGCLEVIRLSPYQVFHLIVFALRPVRGPS
jgi:hypothetical protein